MDGLLEACRNGESSSFDAIHVVCVCVLRKRKQAASRQRTLSNTLCREADHPLLASLRLAIDNWSCSRQLNQYTINNASSTLVTALHACGWAIEAVQQLSRVLQGDSKHL